MSLGSPQQQTNMETDAVLEWNCTAEHSFTEKYKTG